MLRIGLAVALALTLLATSALAKAQRAKVPTIGVLVVGAPGSETFSLLFREAMRELGYVDGPSASSSGRIADRRTAFPN